MTLLPILVIGAGFVLALAVLYFCRAKAWYWHVLSAALASVAAVTPRGSMPLPPAGTNKPLDLTEAFIIVFLFIWGVGALFFRPRRQA